MRSYQYYKDRLNGMTFPYACLDVDMFYKNIGENLKRAEGKKIRIASKSLRCKEAMRMILEYNAQFEGIMAYHGKELLFLANEGFDNLLMGYPIVDRSLIRAIGAELKKGRYICLMVDCPAHMSLINAVGKELEVSFPVCLDIDMSVDFPGLHFGVWRSGIHDGKDAEHTLKKMKDLPYVRLDGIMGYEAQIAGLGDNVKGGGLKNTVIKWLKEKSLRHIRRRRQEAVEMARSLGFELRFVNGGGTGSLETTRQEDVVTEVTVGSGFYNPHLFDYYSGFSLDPALFYGVQVVRKPKKDIYTSHGGGFIASGSVENTKSPIIHLPEGGKLDKLEGAGEVQTPVRFDHLKEPLDIGDPIFMRHAKAGELCERFEKIIFLEADAVREVNTYRGEGVSFG